MIALKVKLNANLHAVAGATDLSVLNAMVQALGKLGPNTVHTRDGSCDLRLRIGGLTSRQNEHEDEHLNWGSPIDLNVGDCIEIEIVDTADVDDPSEQRKYDVDRHTNRRREQWEEAREIYLRDREKFEDPPIA